MFWAKVKSFFSKVWAFIKKIPAGAWVAILLVGATLWYVIRRFWVQKQIIQIQSQRLTEENIKNEKIAKIKDDGRLKEEELTKEYTEKVKELDLKEEELLVALKEGPSEIANKWKEYLRGKNK